MMPAGRIVLAGLVTLTLAACTDAAHNPCDGVTCSGRGFCVADGNRPYCGCLNGYHPVALSCLPNSTTNPCEGVSCSDHGSCRVVDDNPLCDCEPGYHYLADDRCEDIACNLLCIPQTTTDAGPEADAPADLPNDLPNDLPAEAEADAPADLPADLPAEAEADSPPPPECGNGTVETGEDCDGAAPRTCTTTCDSTGSQACVDCHWESACTPPAEFCNGADDDCLSGPDNGFTCVQSSTGTCTTTCGSTGSRTCSATCTWGSCTPPAETCNGADDDCDTACDDGFPCCRGTTRGCTSSSGCSGIQTCTTSCTWGSCSGGDLYCESSCSTGQCWHENVGRTGDCFACMDGACGSCTAGDYSVPCGTYGTCQFENTHDPDYNCHCP